MGRRKLSLEIIKQEASDRGYEILSLDYVNANEKLLFKCLTCNYEYLQKYSDFYNNHGCPKCAGLNKPTINECKEYAESRGFSILENEYFNNRYKMRFLHKECGREFFMVWNAFSGSNQGCPLCNRPENFTIERCREYAESQGYRIVSDKYVMIHEKLEFIHDLCGNEFSMIFRNFYHGNARCPKCMLKQRIETNKKTIVERRGSLGENYPQYIPFWSDKNEKTIFEYTSASRNNSWWICPNGHEDYLAKIDYKVRDDTGCPKCVQSSGENKVFEILKSLGFLENEIISEKRFRDCKNNKPLPFDFYIEKINLCIEFDGKQHYEPVQFGGISKQRAIDGYKKAVKNDKIKNRYCLKNKINILRIPYWEIKNIENIILDKISQII